MLKNSYLANNNSLGQTEERYKSLFMASRDAIMTLEPPSWNFTSANPATIAMFKTKDEAGFLSYRPAQLSPDLQPDGRSSKDKSREMIEIAMQKGSNSFEWVHKRTNGEEFFAEILLSKVEQGENAFLLAVVRDITERKKILDNSARLNKIMVGRELEMIRLKKEIMELKSEIEEKNK